MKHETNHYKNYSLDSLTDNYEGVIYLEQWKPIAGYEGIYEVSTFGRIKSLERIIYDKNGKVVGRYETKILKQTQVSSRGELNLSLCKEGSIKKILVHIIVGRNFIPNPEKKRTINHKKGNPSDNRVWMLEWNTDKENNQHSYRELGRRSGRLGKTGELSPFYGKKGNLHPAFGKRYDRSHKAGENSVRSKKIKCDTLDISFVNITQASANLGISSVSIHKVLSSKSKHAFGLHFRYI